MMLRRIVLIPGLIITLLTGCARNDETGVEESPDLATVGFLLFPNPQLQANGSIQTNTTAYAQAYYTAIDPLNERTTLADWRSKNGFGTGGSGITEFTVVFRDVHDLGYGRRMTVRKNTNNTPADLTDDTLAFMVENYNVTGIPGQTYGSLNLEAAIGRDSRWHVGTNAIEFTPAPNGQTFAKFYNFSSTTGQRQMTANLDGLGQKAMPGICISCHGGRADPLTASGEFPNGGNTRARLQPLNVGTFEFSTMPGHTRADLEANLKTINQLVLCTYLLPQGTAKPTGNAEDDCRPVATSDEWFSQWQSTAGEMVKDWYGGPGMPSPIFSDTYLPAGWVGQETLYNNVVKPYCRTCHILRGTSNQSDVNFMTFAKFQGFADRIKTHVFDRGNMPLAMLVSKRFWNSGGPETLATFLEGQGYTVRSGGTLLRPGRPIADPGPDRTTTVPVTLSGTKSLFASSYFWSIVSTPLGATATLDGTATSSSAQPIFNANLNGNYVLRLVVGNSTQTSTAAQFTLTVATAGSLALPIAPSAIRFSDIRAVLQSSLPGCSGCHNHLSSSQHNGTPPWEPSGFTPPIFYSDYNRGGASATSTTAGDGIYTADNTDDDYWFYLALRGRINFTDIAASPLLRKPTGNHHGGNEPFDFSSTAPCNAPCSGYANLGEYYRAQYQKFVNWILNGAPYN